MRSVPFAPLDPALYREAVRRALAEDLGWGDVTTETTVDGTGEVVRFEGNVVMNLVMESPAPPELEPEPESPPPQARTRSISGKSANTK